MNSKSKLQEYSLKTFKQLPKYTLQKTGPQHDPLFNVEVHTKSKKNDSIRKLKKNCATKSSKKTTRFFEDIMNWEDEGYLLSRENLEKMLISLIYLLSIRKSQWNCFGGNSRKN